MIAPRSPDARRTTAQARVARARSELRRVDLESRANRTPDTRRNLRLAQAALAEALAEAEAL